MTHLMAWLQIIPALTAALAIIAALGLPVAFALRLRGFAIAIIAVPAAFASITVTSIAAPLIGLRWNIISPLIFSFALAAVLLALHRFIGRPAGPVARPHRFWLPVAAAAIGGAVIAFALVRAMKSPGAIMQTHDAVFHYNLIRNVIDEGSASSLAQTLTNPDAPSFYPMLWHAFTALIVQLSGASIPVASNAMTLVAMAVVWPIGAVALARAVVGPNLRNTLIAGILSAAFPMFPYYIIHLSPNMLSLALAPFALVASLQLLNIGRARNGDPLPATARWLLLLGASGAAAIAHPSFLHSFLIWLIFPILWAATRTFRALKTHKDSASIRQAIFIMLALIAFIATILLTWRYLRTGWIGDGMQPVHVAALNIFGAVHNFDGIDIRDWFLGAIITLGTVVAWRRRSVNWLIGTAVLFATLYVISAGSGLYGRITLLTDPWYHRQRSIAALMVWVALPLAVLALSKAAAIGALGLRQVMPYASGDGRSSRRTRVFAALIAIVALVLASHAPLTNMRKYIATERFSASDSPRLLSPKEEALLSRIDEHVPDGSKILGNPWTGTALAYALADYPVLYAQGSVLPSDGEALMMSQLAAGDPAACSLLDSLDVHYLLDFDTRLVEANHPKAEPFAPISGIEPNDLLTELDSEGDGDGDGDGAILYEITGCR